MILLHVHRLPASQRRYEKKFFELIPEFFGFGLSGEDHHCPLEAGDLNANSVLQKLRG
jgi:hypothetical protein